LLLASVALAVFTLPARAQIGAEPIRIVFPFAACGSGDVLTRVLAEHLRITFNLPVIVENRTGAQGRLGVLAVKAAAPRRQNAPAHASRTDVDLPARIPALIKSLACDPIADFAPLSQVATFDLALAVAPQLPAKSLNELVDWVKENPARGS
jgi:tripartite-type tricarboxylate transporter receptor subunit TctC